MCNWKTTIPGFVLILALVCSSVWSQAQAADYRSPSSLALDAKRDVLYAGEHTANSVAVLNLDTGGVKDRFKIPSPPTGLAVSPEGDRLFVTSATTTGDVYVLTLPGGNLIETLQAGHTTMAPVVLNTKKQLYVCNRFENSVTLFDLDSMKAIADIQVPREPVAAVITPDDKWLFVANHLPTGPANEDYTAALVSVIDTTKNNVVTDIQLPNGSTGLRDICLDPKGEYAYVTHILGRYQLPTTQLERGWMNTNALSIINVKTQELFNTVLLDDVDLGAANPWAVACTPDGKSICVTHAGTHELSVIDRIALLEKLTKVASGEKVSDVSSSYEDVPNDLAFLVGLRSRIKLPGRGPRAIAAVGEKLYVAEYFSDTIACVQPGAIPLDRIKSLSLGDMPAITQIRQGEIFFNDASLCFQQWQSCASCHPDARADALNWDLLNDGMGNPKNTKSMLLAHETPPAMITGIRANAEVAVRAGIRHIQFAVRPEEDAQAIDAYLKSLQPVESPYLVDGKLSAAAQRGKAVADAAQCTDCHYGKYYTNLELFDVGTGKGREKDTKFDTPTLKEVWRTAPYLHDGSAATMKALLTTENKDDMHGVTSTLTEAEMNDLIEYINSL